MTTQSNPSPFSTDIKSENIPTSVPQESQQVNEFEMRTMKDDMAKLQSGGIIEEKKLSTVNISPVSSSSSAIKSSTTPKEFNPAEISSEKINPFPEKSFTPAENIEKLVEIPTNNTSNKKSNSTKIVIAFVFILIIAIIGLGAYYFILTKKNNSEPTVVTETEAPAPEITVPAITENPDPVTPTEVPEIKYSEDKPNYLSIDINNLDTTEIKTLIIQVSDELKETSMKSPYEFIIVDSNNNPISFPIFTAAAKINFSQALLSSLGSDFSFYIYNDNSKIRTGLNIEIKNKEALLKELINQEKTFITDASFLFLNDTNELNNNTFSTSTYGKHSIRYSNASATNDLSIDYSIVDSRFILGTSKDTERALIDKISGSQVIGSINQGNCNELVTNLLSCTPYTCESTIKQEINGMQDGKCSYIQYLPNNYKMNCNLTSDMQEKVALTIKEFEETGNASFSSSVSLSDAGTSSTTVSEVNNKPSGLQEALTSGQCLIENK